jgi:predicted dehydrogenase
VLCEKPTALDATEAEAMWRASQGRGVLALMDHELRFLPARQRMRELVLSGELGSVRHARVHYRSGNRADASRPWDWWSDAGQGGGVLGALGSHAVDSLRFLLGREPVEVLGALATHTPARVDAATGASKPVTADEEAEVLLRFGGGLTATVTLSSVEPGEPMHLAEVFGERGGLRVRGTELWRSTVGGRTWERVELPALEPLPRGMPEGEWSQGFVHFARVLTEALRLGRATLEGAATLEDGWRNQLVLDAARRSHSERRWVALMV